jgi:hypothetical protein
MFKSVRKCCPKFFFGFTGFMLMLIGLDAQGWLLLATKILKKAQSHNPYASIFASPMGFPFQLLGGYRKGGRTSSKGRSPLVLQPQGTKKGCDWRLPTTALNL